jgi:hypothetical protein
VNESEVRAYGLVAQAIAKHAFAWAEFEFERKRHHSQFPEATGPIFYHISMSTLEAVVRDLWRLGILRPLDQIGDWAFFFVFDCEVSESNLVAERNCSKGPTLFELLVTFVELFGEFGAEYWGFSAKPSVPFGIDSRILPTLDALSLLGYLEKTHNGYVWTEMIAPVMRESYEFKHWPDATI